MRRRVGWAIGLGLCVSVMGLALSHREPPNAAHGALREVNGVESTPVVPSFPAQLGVIIASESIEVSPRTDGHLSAVYVRLGDRVEAGQELAELDSRSLRSELAMARASVRAAKAEVVRATLEQKLGQARYDRRRGLGRTRAISREEMEVAQYQSDIAGPQLGIARATVNEREARVSQLELALSNAVIVAPFNGTVAARYVNPGTHVAAGTALLRLISEDGTWVRFAVTEDLRQSLGVGHLVEVSVDGSGTKLAGTIEKVSPEVDPASRLIIAEAALSLMPGERNKLLGAVARVTLQ